MTINRRTGLVTAWLISLVLVAVFASAQPPQRPRPGPTTGQVGPVDVDLTHLPEVIAGNDLGFRMESTRDGIAVGKLVIRVNGRWIDAQLGGAGVVPPNAR